MKLRPSLTDHTFIAAKRAKPLRLLLILSGFAKIASVAEKRAGYEIGIRAVRAEGNRLLTCGQSLIMLTLKQARITYRQVAPTVARVGSQGLGSVFQPCLVACRLVPSPTKVNLIGHCEPQ